MLTCYDATFARILVDSEAVDYLLVGDSLGVVIGGGRGTLEVTMDDMFYHTKAVKRGIESSQTKRKPILISDMPVNSYRTADEAVKNAKILIQAGAEMVKVEGPVLEQVRALKAENLRVVGHIGLTPQSIQDYKLQGRDVKEAERLLKEARDLESAGVELLVLEMIPSKLAAEITQELKIPTIGIGAGVGCSGQVLVLYDLLGLNPSFKPRFLKTYASGYSDVRKAVEEYAREVRESMYPDKAHSFHHES